MTASINNPIINSPFEEPRRHFLFTEDGITDRIVAGRRKPKVRDPASQYRSALIPMKDGLTGTASLTESATVWDALRRLSAAEIHAGIASDPDIHATDEAFWQGAEVVLPLRKQQVTMRLDADLLEWFKQERGYQTRINAVLRAYMKAQQNQSMR